MPEKSTGVDDNPRYEIAVVGLKSGKLLAVLWAIALASLLGSCREPKKAGRAARASVACSRACGWKAASGQASSAASCERRCEQFVAQVPACGALAVDYVDCVTAKATAAAQRDNWPVQANDGTLACALPLRLLEQCQSSCQSAGRRSTGELVTGEAPLGQSVRYELTHCGCGSCGSSRGAPPGSRCLAAQVCEAATVHCDGGVQSYRLRACAAEVCLGPAAMSGWLHRVLPGSGCTAASDRRR